MMENLDRRWAQILGRAPRDESGFIYAVKTTGIYCNTDCPSRRPLLRNIVLFETPQMAERAGFRACKRCQPDLAVYSAASGATYSGSSGKPF